MISARTAWLVSVLGILPVPTSVPHQDTPPTSKVILSVGGEVPWPLQLTAPKFARLPRQTVRAKDHDGKEAEFAGVPLVEVLKASGVKFGQDLRGPALALTSLSRQPTVTVPSSPCPNWIPLSPIASSCWPTGETGSSWAGTQARCA
jgi:hypothetical protein